MFKLSNLASDTVSFKICFLEQLNVPSSPCTFPVPQLEVAISPSFFVCVNGTRDGNLSTRHVLCCQGEVTSRPFSADKLDSIDFKIHEFMFVFLIQF